MTKIKREIDKYPYGNSQGLSEDEAQSNIIATGEFLLELMEEYGPVVCRVAAIALLKGALPAFAADPSSTPSGGPDSCNSPGSQSSGGQLVPISNNVLPATKELLGIAAVGLMCAAAAANPVTALGIAACIVAIAAKAANKL